MLANNEEYFGVLENVKREIANAQQRAVASANEEVVRLYWRVGSVLNEHSEYGKTFIESLAKDIKTAFPKIKGFSARSMWYMQKFACEVDPEFCSSCCRIPWGHVMYVLDKTKPGPAREWYVDATIENGWSRAVLVHQIESKLYERQVLAGKVDNFKRTLPAPESELAQQALKDPYIFDFITARQGAVEREVEERMMENLTGLLLELGTGFAFMGRQHHLVVGGQDFYIDLLFYNVKLRSYIVVELKNAPFKPEFVGKLNFYLSAVDDLLCGEHDNPSIGLLLCKTKNNVVAEYSLRDVEKPIGVSEYRLADVLPEGFADLLPSAEDIEKRL
ncbi:PDDEXK nuclease domain-containing protein [Eggerthella sinensis]|uniref:PDDEXK nuclease domain-containing protein n=1 Tax=Eggerthella sinensis TaxID=242230 RepID=UPI001D08799A|nr:PDDEXK nuclease domain-containing protein [Eggerthella sinensis]MCB7038213.1 PDDEXK nuclease domain-containing protein [Eggerthella sinensis]